MGKEWFKTWFNTDYYHLLYRNRDEQEARRFIDALLSFLRPEAHARFLDVACGKGRHSRYLNGLGFDVIGIDLSKKSIQDAQACSEGVERLQFIQHDIRRPFPVGEVDVAVNLFTSFGYFEDDEQHQQALENIASSLKPKGKLVLDYLNTAEVVHHLKREDHSAYEGIRFMITRSVEEQKIVKRIQVIDGDETHAFEERVRAFTQEELSLLISRSGFDILETFGNYQLEPYSEHSPRVVIIAQKKQ